jgi:hypothetical protein
MGNCTHVNYANDCIHVYVVDIQVYILPLGPIGARHCPWERVVIDKITSHSQVKAKCLGIIYQKVYIYPKRLFSPMLRFFTRVETG